MKNILKYTLLLLGPAALLLGSCGKEMPVADIEVPQNVIDVQNPTDTETLIARIEPAGEISVTTKTSYDSVEGKFSWSEDDGIAIHYNSGGYAIGTVKASGTVSVTAPATGAQRDYYAVYPYGAATYPSSVADNYGNPDLQVYYPTNYDLTETVDGNDSFEESLCPMVAKNDPDKSTLDFYHVGGLLRMNMTMLDASSAYVLFTFDKDVSGIYTVADPGTDHPTVTTRGNVSDNNNIIWVSLNSGNGLGYRNFSNPFYINIPVPCGTYSNIKVEILSESGQVQESATIPRLTFARRHGKRINFADFCDRKLTSAYVPGKFRVSPTKSVYFASGNLVVTYRSSGNHEWEFEANQYDFTDVVINNIDYETDGQRISHFGWGTGNKPYEVSTDEGDYPAFYDWGRHFDDAGVGLNSSTDGTWYTLSRAQWNYLLKSRPNADNLVAKGKIYVATENKYVSGLFILCDDWQLPSGCEFNPEQRLDYDGNVYTTGTVDTEFDGSWQAMEAAGAVFLPSVGFRSSGGNWFWEQNYSGPYWTSTEYDGQSGWAYQMIITKNAYEHSANSFSSLRFGSAVRLVHD